MNLQDKLHERVYVPLKTDWKIKYNPETTLITALKNTGERDGDKMLLTGIFTESNAGLLVSESLQRAEPSYLLTPLELLELRKKWASEDWDAAFKKSGENMIDHVIEISNPAPDKETYINSLTL